MILWLKKKLKEISLLGTPRSFTSINRIQKSNYNTWTYKIKPKLVSLSQTKLYSTSNHLKYSSAVVYSNADLDKLKILNENKNKSGVYLWKNLINNEIYVGSSKNLSRRFTFYFSILSLINYKNRSHIISALLKYGYSNFSLEVLEYCKPEKNLIREQYYLDLLKPSYNILLKADSTLGRKHSLASIEKMRKAKKLNSNTFAGTAAVSKPVEITDTLTKKTTIYPSILSAEAALKAGGGSFNYCLKKEKLYKKRYIIKLLKI